MIRRTIINRERLFSLTEGGPIVHRDKSGKVSPQWLSACRDERNSTVGLMDKIADPLNIQKAYRRVRSNGGSAGIDEMDVKELGVWLSAHLQELSEELRSDRYQPAAVRGVHIPKPQGGYRQLGIPTVKDRLIQQAIHQVLNVRYERTFSEYSYGFRPDKSAHQALAQACTYVKSGQTMVVDLDLEKFFDEVNHHRLMWLLRQRIGDERVVNLIYRFVKAGMLEGGLISQRVKGTPQGGPLSPLLSNIVLDELDKELERREHHYVRYADDVKIFVGSEQAGERVKLRITRYIEEKLKLKVNRSKSRVCPSHKLNFLGHSILPHGEPGLSEKSDKRLKEKVRAITQRNRGVEFKEVVLELSSYLKGWLLYFRHAQMGRRMNHVDSWIRRRVRSFRLKQCKYPRTIANWLQRQGVKPSLSWRTALSGKGWWRLSNSPGVSIGMNNSWLATQGYYSLATHYHALHCKPL